MTMAEEKNPENRFIYLLLEKLLSEKYREAFVGDLLESYEVRAADNRFRAKIWLLFQLLSSFSSLLRKSFYGSAAMFKNYFLMAFRNLKKHRTYALINVFGLAIGLSAALLILLYLQFEISYDRFHENTDSIYRVCIRHIREGRSEMESHVFTPPIGPDMKKDFPEVEDYVRMSTLRLAYLNVGNKAFKVNRIRYASPRLFEVFCFKLKTGNPQTALIDPFSIVLSEQTSERIFGSKDPLLLRPKCAHRFGELLHVLSTGHLYPPDRLYKLRQSHHRPSGTTSQGSRDKESDRCPSEKPDPTVPGRIFGHDHPGFRRWYRSLFYSDLYL